MLRRVAAETETVFPFDRWASRFPRAEGLSLQEAVAAGAVAMARDIGAAAILTCTHSGSTSRLVSKYRPAQPILAVTAEEETYHRLSLHWGTVPLYSPAGETGGGLEEGAVRAALRAGELRIGDRVVVAAGLPIEEEGITNHIRVMTVTSRAVIEMARMSE
jgi:pyruvate kinase